jgi:transcriptional regulator with XRE-family HTH domain
LVYLKINGNEMNKDNQVGSKISQLRQNRNITIEQLSNNSQLSVGFIAKLEAGQLAPSLSPLLKIARGLGVRLGTFLDDAPQTGPVIVRSGHSEKVVRFSGNDKTNKQSILDFSSLGADKKDRHMEPFIVNVHPLVGEHINLSSHEGEEFIYVLSGEIEVYYGKDKLTVKTEDSIYYDSIVPHYVHAGGNTDAKILAVIYTPF